MKMTSQPIQPIQRRLALIPALLLAWLGVLASAHADLNNGLVGWWKLNETSGTTASDSSGSGNHGTLSTNMRPVSGAPIGGTALFFNGAQRVSVTDSPSLNMTAGISIGAWVKTENWNSPSVILSKGTGVAYQYTLQAASGYLMFNLNGGFPGHIELTMSLPSTGVWHHIAGTFDGSQIALYLDGTVVTQRVATGSIVSSANQLNIGAILGPPDPYGFFTGAISDVRVYNRALHKAEIGALASAQGETCLPSPSGRIAWWPGDGNANDIQGTNNGTLIGTTFASGKVGQAFQFNGGNYVQIQGGEVLNPTNISIEGWFNVAQQNRYGSALAGTWPGSGAGWSLFIVDGLRPKIDLYNAQTSITTVLSAVPITLNTWAHIAATYDGTNARIFVNGALQGTVAFPGGYTPSSTPMLIGASWCESYGCFGYDFRLTGFVDELSIYNRALTAAEIQAIYAADSGGMCKAPAIFTQPSSRTVVANSNATFSVSAAGLPPLFYQWQFNVTNLLSGQTNSSLILTNISFSQAGTYSVLVSNSFGSVVSSNATLTVLAAGADDDGDGLLNEQEIQFGTNLFLADSDGDGLSDYDELFVFGTNPLKADTDGDGMPDGWEVQHGLNPRSNDAADDLDGDGLSNPAEYNWSLSHSNQLIDPRTKYSTSATMSDFAVVTGAGTNQFFYDRNNRLIGAEFDRGLALAYVYDGNDNLVRQVSMRHDANTNGLPDVWEFLNGLTNNTSTYADSDGDGWTDYQEWKAGTNPRDPLSTPNLLGTNLLGNPGTQIASLQLPFTPSNFVAGVGQLDGLGAEEIVLGGDGNPGTNLNSLLVLTQGATTWSTQRVDVGPFGITSIAVGQVTNRPSPAIYVGLRGTTNGSGRVMEFTSIGGVWQSNLVALSTNQAAFVLGVRGPDVLVSLATTNAPDGSLSAVRFTTNWSSSLMDTNTSHRGLGTVRAVGAQGDAGVRLLDGGGVAFYNFPPGIVRTNFPPNAVYRAVNRKWYFVTPTQMTWDDGLVFAQQHGGTLVAIEDASENDFVKVLNSSSELWIGLYRNAGSNKDNPSSWIWTSGSFSSFRNWLPGSPNSVEDSERFIVLHTLDGKWDDAASGFNRFAVGQVTGTVGQVSGTGFYAVQVNEPTTTRNLLWRGSSFAGGFLRGTNSSSIFYTFADDKNANGLIDFGDDFVTAEYLVIGTNASLLTLSPQPIVSLTQAQSYGLASVNFLNASNEVFFTGEPDGQVFAWTSTGATNPLQRQLFTGHHAGKAWHALSSLKTVEPGEGLIGLRVDPTNQSRCDIMFWSPQSQLPQITRAPQTAPAAVVLPATNTLGNSALMTVRLWDAEGNASTPFLQYQLSGSTNWQDASISFLDGTPYAPTLRVTALPGGTNHPLVWNALTNLGPGVATNILLRARASDLTLLGDWSAGTPFTIQTTANPDTDNEGLPDAWEIQYFGSTAPNPNDDPDGDGFNNWQEYIADTNPRNTASQVAISVSLLPGGVKLDWLAGSNSWKYLQRANSLNETNTAWMNIWTSPPPPSPDSGSYTDFFGTNAMLFYRIRVTR